MSGQIFSSSEFWLLTGLGFAIATIVSGRAYGILRESEELYRLTFEQATVGIMHIAPDGSYLRVNPHALTLLGYTEDEFRRLSVQELAHPDERERETDALHRMARGETTSYSTEKRYRRRDGSYLWAQLNTVMTTDRDGRAKHFITVIQDIGPRKGIEGELGARVAELRTLTDAIPQQVWKSDLSGRLAYCNEQFLQYYGMAFDELRDWDGWERVLHPDDFASVRAAWARCTALGEDFGMEYRLRRAADGQYRWHLCRARALRDEGGKIFCWFGTNTDIDEMRKLEEKIADQQARLVVSAKLSSLGEMAGGIAHEINNPLSIIHAKSARMKEMLSGSAPDLHWIGDAAGKIESFSNRISRIIRAMRFVARDGENDPLETVALVQILSDVRELSQERFREHAIRLDIPEADPGVTVTCRPVQVSQVLINLLNNAHDAVSELPPGAERWVRLEARVSDGGLEVAVVDSGAGIAPAIADKIMQPFFTTKEPGAGTGLGLSVSRGIVESHGGTLTLDHAAGPTRFVVRLPLARGLASAA